MRVSTSASTGFSGLVDALRYGQREGLFRLDRDRQGVVRVFPGVKYQRPGGVDGAGGPDQAQSDLTPIPSEPSEGLTDQTLATETGQTTTAEAFDAAEARDGDNGERGAVDSVTYDVVTHVDPASGVIDVAPHGTSAPPDDAASDADGRPKAARGGRGRKTAGPRAAAGRARAPKAATPPGGGARKRASAASPERGRRKKASGEPPD